MDYKKIYYNIYKMYLNIQNIVSYVPVNYKKITIYNYFVPI